MQGVAAAWLMTSLTSSTTLVGLVQTASTLPVFLVGLLAGALADTMERKTVLFWSQVWMLCMATLLGVLSLAGWTTPWVLLGLSFFLGLGAAMNMPTWQATLGDVVPKRCVPAAVALNSVGFNIARAIGPALGGVVVALTSASMVFLINAASFVAVLAAVTSWKPTPKPPAKHTEDVFGAIRAGMRYFLHAPRLQSPTLRAAVFNLFAPAMMPLLPLFARDVLKTTATGYGFLLAVFGIGSVLAGLAVPRLRSSFAMGRILAAGSIVLTLGFIGLGLTANIYVAGAMLFFIGFAWVGSMINFNVAVQTAVPGWVRGRALAIYLLVVQGVLALDGILWGYLAGVVGTSECFLIAAGGLMVVLAFSRFMPITLNDDLDFNPPKDWPYSHESMLFDPADGPVLVTVEFSIAPENADEFRMLMRQLREQRLRDGARRWRLYHDMENPTRFLELYRLDSWGEHLLQHERVTEHDLPLRAAVFALHQGPDKPKVTHHLGVEE